MADFSRDLAPDLRDDRCGLTQLRGLQSRIADLSGSINLTYINDLVGVEFFPIVLFNSASCFRSSTSIASDRFARAGIHTGDLLAGLSVDRDFHVALVLLAAGNRFTSGSGLQAGGGLAEGIGTLIDTAIPVTDTCVVKSPAQ